MRIKNIIAAICGVILIACMASGLPVFAAETDGVVYVDINGDGQTDEQEIAYAEALAIQTATQDDTTQIAVTQTSDITYVDINGDGRIDAQEIAYADALALQMQAGLTQTNVIQTGVVQVGETQTSALQTSDVIYKDIDGDGQISQAERDYADALKAMQDYHERLSALEAAGTSSAEEITDEVAAEEAADGEIATEDTTVEETEVIPAWDGTRLNKDRGSIYGPSGKECWYNLNMTPVITLAQQRGVSGSFWVRDDGVKMYGNYIMAAACYAVHPYGSLVETSLGTAIVLDTGGFAETMPNLIDIAVRW